LNTLTIDFDLRLVNALRTDDRRRPPFPFVDERVRYAVGIV